jgi:hypothetical protein
MNKPVGLDLITASDNASNNGHSLKLAGIMAGHGNSQAYHDA